MSENICKNEIASEINPTPEENQTDNKKNGIEAKKKKTPGVIYLSRIPTKMNVKLIRDYFSRFGTVDRIYLEPQEKKRKNQARTFSEGWVEFKSKNIAVKIAHDLNNTQVGGKRRNPWYHELWNLKYLKKFRWTHLNERKAYEQEARKQRLRQEIALAKKETNFYIQNVEKNEKKKRFDKKMQKIGDNQNDSVDMIQQISTNSEKTNQNNDNQNENTDHPNIKKHPHFERKIKVVGNDLFLKQIFS